MPVKLGPFKVADPVAEARSLMASGATSVDLWSMSEQQFVMTFRPKDVGDAPAKAQAIAKAPAKKVGKGGEYYPDPGGTDSSALPPLLFVTFEAFRERGAATVREIAEILGRSTDVVASHATRLKNMGLLRKEER
jgi:hypothetical protein